MYKILLIVFPVILLCSIGCSGGEWSPTYPYDYGGYNGGTYDNNKPPYDNGYDNNNNEPDYTRYMEGEWEGFMYEHNRSDYLPLGKKMIAMKISWVDYCGYGSSRYERVKVSVLIDGRPAALDTVDVRCSDYMSLDSYKDEIDLQMETWFEECEASGSMDLAWDEKVKLPHSDKVEMHYVELSGSYDLDRVKGSQWADAWALFDQYGDQAFELDDSVWQTATQAGMDHLAELEVTGVSPY